MSRIRELTKVKEINGTDLLKLKVEDESGAITESFWFYNYTDAMFYMDKDVIVDYRNEMIDGNMCLAVNTFTVPTQINTLSKQENIKLFCDAKDNFATVSFRDVSDGEVLPNAVVYCISQELRSSPKAVWMEFTIRDMFMHVATLRLFDYEDSNREYAGHYIVVSGLEKSKYGFQTDCIAIAQGDVQINPEITIAKEYIRNFFADNAEALSCIEMFKLFEHFDNSIDYEKGYGVVRLATELSLAEQLANVTNSVNVRAIEEALLCSHLYLTQPNSILSKLVRNCMLTIKVNFTNKKLIILMLDETTDNVPAERKVFDNIKELADTLMEVRKGVTF